MWRPNKGKGWGQGQEAEPANRFTQVLRTVLEVVPGGVIRYGKSGPDDDSHTGFWLGVTAEGVAKFSIGGPGGWLKWDGAKLLIRGSLSTWTGASWPDWIEWVGGDEETVGYVCATDSWGHILEIGVPRSIGAGDPQMIDIMADGDLDAMLRF